MKKAIILATLFLSFISACSKTETPSSNVEKVYTVRKQKFVYAITATGYVVPQKEVLIKSKASGEIIYFPYEEGDYVKEGSILLKLDPKDEKRNLKLAQANFDYAAAKLKIAEINYKASKADLEPQIALAEAAESAAAVNAELARKNYERKKQLYAKNIVSQEEYENAEKAFKLAMIDLETARAKLQIAKNKLYEVEQQKETLKLYESDMLQAQIKLDDAKQRLDETVIYAPMSGVVMEKYVEKGQIIASGINSVSGGTNLLKLGDISRYYILAQVDESDIGVIRKGQKCSLSFDALRDKKFTGKIVRIYPQGKQISGITVYTIKIGIVSGPMSMLKPQMSCDVSIVVNEIDDALTVPLDAVIEKRGRQFVYLKAGDSRRLQPISTSATDGKVFVVDSGLKPGDVIIIPQFSTNNNDQRSFVDIRRRQRPSRKR